MRENTARFVYTRTKPTGVYLSKKDTFKEGKSKKHEWLQRLCFKILAKLEAYDTYPEATYETIVIDKKGFVERFLEQQRALIKEFNVGIDSRFRLIIGASDFRELMCSPEINQMLTFDTTFNVVNNGIQSVMGMEVTIVPWMQGAVILPRE